MYYVCICLWVCSYTYKEQIHAFNWHQSHSGPICLPGHPCLVTVRIMRGPGCFCSHEDNLPSIIILSGRLWHALGLSALCLLTPRPLLSPCYGGLHSLQGVEIRCQCLASCRDGEGWGRRQGASSLLTGPAHLVHFALDSSKALLSLSSRRPLPETNTSTEDQVSKTLLLSGFQRGRGRRGKYGEQHMYYLQKRSCHR